MWALWALVACAAAMGIYGVCVALKDLWLFLRSWDWVEIYWVGRLWAMWIIFIGAWIYCIAAYGFLLGVGLGWLAAGITAFVLSFLWPLIPLGLLSALFFLATESESLSKRDELLSGLPN